MSSFSYESFCAAFMCLQFGFVIFWPKDFGAKAAHKMLVKLTPVQSLIWPWPAGGKPVPIKTEPQVTKT